MSDTTPTNLANLIWQVADLLRGEYKRADYGKVILPFTVLRRLECVLEPTRQAVRDEKAKWEAKGTDPAPYLPRKAGYGFYNTTKHTLESVAGAPDDAATNLMKYLSGFSENARVVFERYRFQQQVAYLAEARLLHQVVAAFADVDLHPEEVSNHEMGYAFEELIRKFAEESNETAGEHFTPREVIELMAGLLIAPDLADLKVPSASRKVYDPACGTGGMLTAAQEFILKHNASANVYVFGQELNPESWAICRSDLMIKNEEVGRIKLGNSFSKDQLEHERFDYLLSNPPFGVEWKKVQKEVRDEYEDRGFEGRFGAGLPRINDGSLLFLQHMISKRKPVSEGGSRLAIVFNGSPLFTGGAGSGESEIRRWILEQDWLEAIIALPDQLFYNTGISTYFWVLTNHKAPAHRGKVMLVDARDHWVKMRKSLGDKRKRIDKPQIEEIMRLYADAPAIAGDPEHPQHSKVKTFANRDFGYHRITVERPLKLRFEVNDETLAQVRDSKAIEKLVGAEALVSALKPLVGSVWRTKREAWATLRENMAEAGVLWPSGTPFQKALREAIGVRDPEGEVQLIKGNPEPDPELRDYENVPLDEDVDAYLEREVLPHADYLDAETDRIDRIVEVRRRQVGIFDERKRAILDAEHDRLASDWGTVRLRHAIRLIEQGWSPECEDRRMGGTEWAVVKAGCVNGGEFLPEEHKVLPPHLTPRLEYLLRPGDLLMSRASGSRDLIGSVGIVPEGNERLLLCDKVYRIELDRSRLETRFAALMLQTTPIREQIQLGISGAGGLANNLPTAIVKGLPVPAPSLDIQRRSRDAMDERSAQQAEVRRKVSQQLTLLEERRRALITAAVTGEIDVTTAPGVDVS
ncbi:MAG: N-6 DNA methylase [Natronosporangium sp.]